MATTVATIGASGAAVAALWFSGQSLRATNEQHALSQQTAVTERFRLAAEQPASNQINVRLSGIYLFERLAKDAPADHPTVFELLISFLHTHSEATACRSMVSFGRTLFKDLAEPPDSVPVDVQAALTVLARRDSEHDEFLEKPNLRHLCLPAATFALPGDRSAPLQLADFTSTQLRHANFAGRRRSLPTRSDSCGPGPRPANRSRCWPPSSVSPARPSTTTCELPQ